MTDTMTAIPDRLTRRDGNGGHRVCPWWIGYLMASPIRRLLENPRRILAPLVRPGMTVCDIGCAMGFFSLPLAGMVGPAGRVICVDMQERMLESLRRRARRRGLARTIETRACTADDLGMDDLAGQVDLVVAYHVVHEVPSKLRFLRECLTVLRPGGRLLLAEPKGHVPVEEFECELEIAAALGFEVVPYRASRRGHGALLRKPEAAHR